MICRHMYTKYEKIQCVGLRLQHKTHCLFQQKREGRASNCVRRSISTDKTRVSLAIPGEIESWLVQMSCVSRVNLLTWINLVNFRDMELMNPTKSYKRLPSLDQKRLTSRHLSSFHKTPRSWCSHPRLCPPPEDFTDAPDEIPKKRF